MKEVSYEFRSRLEVRWAVFFDVCKVRWEYEPEGYDLGDGIYYPPDFLLYNVAGRDGGDLYVEVKGKMTDKDAEKINRFVELGKKNPMLIGKSKTATLVVGEIPRGFDMDEITNFIGWNAYNAYPKEKYWWPNPYNFDSIDGDYFAAHPRINHEGKFEQFGDDSTYLVNMDRRLTERARTAAFHSFEPCGKRVSLHIRQRNMEHPEAVHEGTFQIGYRPYGYDNVNGQMIVNEEQAAVVRRI